MTREITHMKAFTAALESHRKAAVLDRAGFRPPPILVDQFFNDSTGTGEDGEIDARGPWNQGEDLRRWCSPRLQDCRADRGVDSRLSTTADVHGRATDMVQGAPRRAQLQDLLHAEGQLLKALPKMIGGPTRRCSPSRSKNIWPKLKIKSGRLNEVFSLLGEDAKPKPCKGMGRTARRG